jgi:hypothetical protein
MSTFDDEFNKRIQDIEIQDKTNEVMRSLGERGFLQQSNLEMIMS